MKFAVVAALLLAGAAFAAEHQVAKVHTIETVTPKDVKITIDDIVNIGKIVWDIVKAGKPVVNYQTDFAGATPRDADWLDLSGFETHNYGPFGWTFKDVYGVKTAAFSWYFTYSCKGTYDGHGAFLDNVGPAYKEIYAAWGFNVDVNASVSHPPTNHGSHTDPVAGLQVEVTMEVSTVLQHYVNKCRVEILGDCTTKIISCDGYNK